MNKTEQIIEDCPHFMYGCCQKYLDGDCSTHKCDLKIIRELQQEVQETKDNYVKLDLLRVKEYNKLVDEYKAKEQECEELKSDLTDLSKIIDCKNGTILTFKEQLDQLKADNEELKRQHESDKGLITSTGKMNYQLIQEYDKLKNCLTGIKEIAEPFCNACQEFELEKKGRNCMYCNYGKILQKISEVVE